jgi:hypothetical protein
MRQQIANRMTRIISIPVVVLIVFSAGCSIRYPVFRREYSSFARKEFRLQQDAVLLKQGPILEIQSGRIEGGKRVVELPIGTPIAIRSFWRERSWGLKSGLTRHDYAMAKVADSAGPSALARARVPVSEFDDLFDGEKYIPASTPERMLVREEWRQWEAAVSE